MNKLKLIFNKILHRCRHNYITVELFGGDRRNIANGIERCSKCGKERYF